MSERRDGERGVCPICGADIIPPKTGCSVCLWKPGDDWKPKPKPLPDDRP